MNTSQQPRKQNNAGLLCLLLATVLTSACSHLGLTKTPATEPATAAQKQEDSEPKYRDFDQNKDTLHDLLVAEIAAQRDQFDITLLNYLQQAHITRDVDIIQRAINAAQLSKDAEALSEMALLWVDVDPNSVPARQILVFQRTLEQEYEQAMEHIDKIIELEGDARVDSLAITASSLPDEDRVRLAKLYEALHNKYPQHHEVSYSYALVLKAIKEYDQALEILAPVLKEAPDFEAPTVLKTNLLYDKGELEKAIDYAEDKFDDFPKNHNLGRLYATMLIEARELDKAEKVFESLIEYYPHAARLKLSLAIVKLENKKIEEAKTHFDDLISMGKLTNASHFYLARIADLQQDVDLAIQHYQKVKPGPHYDTSLERYLFLMFQHDQRDQALAKLAEFRKEDPSNSLKYWLLEVKLLSSSKDETAIEQALDNAIAEFPDDEQLVYTRAMQREAKDDLAGMEADLRHLIEKDPNNAIALNALGYTLADRTDRLVEAFELIQRAVAVKPNNPAILDSMGWVLYKLGKNKEALVFLLKAFQQFQDGEIAAHLGEVLFSLNQRTEAHEVWGALFIKQPEHEVLNETVKRLDPEFYEQVQATLEKMREQAREQNQGTSTKLIDLPSPTEPLETDSTATP